MVVSSFVEGEVSLVGADSVIEDDPTVDLMDVGSTAAAWCLVVIGYGNVGGIMCVSMHPVLLKYILSTCPQM